MISCPGLRLINIGCTWNLDITIQVGLLKSIDIPIPTAPQRRCGQCCF